MCKTEIRALSAKENQHEYNKKYYAEHREKELQRVAEYKKQHREELKVKNRQYREKNADRIKAYRDTPKMKQYQHEYQKMYRAKKKIEAEQKEQAKLEEMSEQIDKFVENSLEAVRIIDCLLDIDEKELDICTKKQHSKITDFRNFLAEFSNRLMKKDEEQQRKQEDAILILSDEEEDGGEDLYIMHTKPKNVDRELC